MFFFCAPKAVLQTKSSAVVVVGVATVAQRPQDDADVVLQQALAVAKDGLFQACRSDGARAHVEVHYVETSTNNKVEIDKVVAKDRFDKGKLVLVPLSHNINICPDSKVPSSSVVFPVFKDLPSGYKVYVTSSQMWPTAVAKAEKMGAPKKRQFVAAYWTIPTAAAPNEGNMTTGVVKVDVDKYTSSSSGDCKSQISVPCLVNTRVVKDGDMLFRVSPVPSSPSKKDEGPSTKKARK
eukprot:4431055-Pyramimonas_sp.AAC.1